MLQLRTFTRGRCQIRRGALTILAALLLVLVAVFLALAMDVGYVCLVRTEAQAAADAAALAGGRVLINEDRLRGAYGAAYENARNTAVQFAARNRIASQPASLVAPKDVQIGRLDNPMNRNGQLNQSDPTKFNALTVTIGAQAPLFFGFIFGRTGFDSQATATVAFCDEIAGFRLPNNSDATVPLLPFTLELTEWRNFLENGGDDNFQYDSESNLVIPGRDGIPEIKLFPVSQGAGNWGTVDIGSRINSTADLHRQIQDGVNASDLAHHGGSLELNPSTGTLTLNGEPGISAGIKTALETIIGQPRAIPLFRTLGGQGETLNYEIVGFAGIRILEVQVTEQDKRLVVQPAFIVESNTIPANQPTETYFVVQPPQLVR